MQHKFKDSYTVYNYVMQRVVSIMQNNPHLHTNVRTLEQTKKSVDCQPYEGDDITFTVAVSKDVFNILHDEMKSVTGALHSDKLKPGVKASPNWKFAGRPLIVVNNRVDFVQVYVSFDPTEE